MKAQGATRSFCGTTYRPLHGQGATEYLVLLAVVLIVALVSVALLGFFPGMASDAQVTQSKMYWQSAQPISIIEMSVGARGDYSNQGCVPYLRLRNVGAYPIRITKLLGNNGRYSTNVWITSWASTISDNYYMAPGEEKYFGNTYQGLPEHRWVDFSPQPTGDGTWLNGLSATCSLTQPYGTMVMQNFGFEYIEYLEGQQITKREIGAKPLMIKCTAPLW